MLKEEAMLIKERLNSDGLMVWLVRKVYTGRCNSRDADHRRSWGHTTNDYSVMDQMFIQNNNGSWVRKHLKPGWTGIILQSLVRKKPCSKIEKLQRQ